MERTLQEIKSKIKLLSIYQIVGGCIGLAITIWIIVNYLTAINGLTFLLFLVALGLYSYSIYCGILLHKNLKLGLKHSLINQVLQVLNFAMFGYAFLYVSGIYISVGVDLTNSFNLKFNFGFSTWKITFNTDPQLVYVNINLIAISLIVSIDNIQKKLYKAEMEKQLSEMIQKV